MAATRSSPQVRGYPSLEDYQAILCRFPTYLRYGWRADGKPAAFFGDPSHGEAGLRSMGNVVFTAALLAMDEDFSPLLLAASSDEMLHRAREGLHYMTQGHVSGTGCCADGSRWGGVWQSSWWTTRMAMGARLLWSELTAEEQRAVERVVVHEAELQLRRFAPSGLAEDTKAEENAWDTEILAAALALFPEHPRRDGWRAKMLEFAMNTLSVPQDRTESSLIGGKPVCDQVYTANLHSDFTLENHGAYHFCYVASPLQSIAWSYYALAGGGHEPVPAALFHHVEDLWNTVKPTFLDNRFAYVGGKDWARYTYGLYFIVPPLVLLQSRFEDGDARVIEAARVAMLASEQQENDDGSFFGRRFTGGKCFGQAAKYETDCFANLALAYSLHKLLAPAVAPTPPAEFQRHLCARHISHESGVSFVRNERLFASFSWRTLTTPFPNALFVPIGADDMAEWHANNLLGYVETREPSFSVSIRVMVASKEGFRVEGVVAHRDRKAAPLYDHHLVYEVDPGARCAHVQYRYVAKRRIFVRRALGLYLSVANDRFNGYRRVYRGDHGESEVVFRPPQQSAVGGRRSLIERIRSKLVRELGFGLERTELGHSWVNIDDRLGVARVAAHPASFTVLSPDRRNLGDGSLHGDYLVVAQEKSRRYYDPEETILEGQFVLLAGTADETKALAEDQSHSSRLDFRPLV